MVRFFLKGNEHRVYFLEDGRESLVALADRLHARGTFADRVRAKIGRGGPSNRPPVWSRLVARVTNVATHGVANAARSTHWVTHFKGLEGVGKGSGYEIRQPTDGIRLAFFTEPVEDGPPNIVITHSFTKKKDKTDQKELDRLCRLWQEYVAFRDGHGAASAEDLIDILTRS